jgi:arylsulfatase A-like enzyme
MIVRWPDVAKAGSVCDRYVISTDFYPTMLDMTGLPLRPDQHVDGVSFAPHLKGKDDNKRGPIFWHYPHYGNQGGSPSAALRDGDWKLIRFFEDNRTELYNLASDIGEHHELSSAESDRTRIMQRQLDEWLAGVGARMPSSNPNWKPAAGESDSIR